MVAELAVAVEPAETKPPNRKAGVEGGNVCPNKKLMITLFQLSPQIKEEITNLLNKKNVPLSKDIFYLNIKFIS